MPSSLLSLTWIIIIIHYASCNKYKHHNVETVVGFHVIVNISYVWDVSTNETCCGQYVVSYDHIYQNIQNLLYLEIQQLDIITITDISSNTHDLLSSNWTYSNLTSELDIILQIICTPFEMEIDTCPEKFTALIEDYVTLDLSTDLMDVLTTEIDLILIQDIDTNIQKFTIYDSDSNETDILVIIILMSAVFCMVVIIVVTVAFFCKQIHCGCFGVVFRGGKYRKYTGMKSTEEQEEPREEEQVLTIHKTKKLVTKVI